MCTTKIRTLDIEQGFFDARVADANVARVDPLLPDIRDITSHVIPLRAVRYVLERRRKERCPNAKDDDFVMSLPNGEVFSSFDGGVKRLFAAADLLKDPKSGKNRGIYSCRHTYATGALNAGRNAIDVARNMGTSLAMLEKSYFHFLAKDVADRLTGKRGAR
jgi:integrase